MRLPRSFPAWSLSWTSRIGGELTSARSVASSGCRPKNASGTWSRSPTADGDPLRRSLSRCDGTRVSFDPVEICAVLTAESVEFVILGGFVAVIHGSALPTEDIDVVPSRELENLVRLATALKRLGAKFRTGGEAVATNIDAAFIASMPLMLNLVTNYGHVDLTFAPAGQLAGYDDWKPRSRPARSGRRTCGAIRVPSAHPCTRSTLGSPSPNSDDARGLG